MPLSVLPIQDDDWQTIGPFSQDAFADEFIWYITFPYENSPEGKAKVAERYRSEYREEPDYQYVKVVDDATAEIISAGAWAFYDCDPFERDGEGKGVNKVYGSPWWGDKKMDAEHCSWVNNSVRDARRYNPLLKGKGHAYLYLALTDPLKYRRGGASALVKWGTDRADAMGVPCIVDASRYAHKHKVYHKHGFKDYGVIFLHDKERYPGKPAVDIVTMYRPAPGETYTERSI